MIHKIRSIFGLTGEKINRGTYIKIIFQALVIVFVAFCVSISLDNTGVSGWNALDLLAGLGILISVALFLFVFVCASWYRLLDLGLTPWLLLLLFVPLLQLVLICVLFFKKKSNSI